MKLPLMIAAGIFVALVGLLGFTMIEKPKNTNFENTRRFAR